MSLVTNNIPYVIMNVIDRLYVLCHEKYSFEYKYLVWTLY